MKWSQILFAAMGKILQGRTERKNPPSMLPGHEIIGKGMQGYLTGQGKPAMRPVYRAKLVDRSKYKPHQGKQECGRRVRQMLNSI